MTKSLAVTFSFFTAVLLPFLAFANPTPITLNITGTGATAQQADVGSQGECNVADWVNVCPSGECKCLQVAVSSVAGTGLGKGHHLSVTNFFITVDNHFTPSTEQSTGQCNLFFAVMTVDGKHGSGAINAYGTACQQYPNYKATTLNGGWGVSDNPAPTTGTGGWGTLTGSASQNSVVKLKVTGWLGQ
jgi:hypothetical protein